MRTLQSPLCIHNSLFGRSTVLKAHCLAASSPVREQVSAALRSSVQIGPTSHAHCLQSVGVKMTFFPVDVAYH